MDAARDIAAGFLNPPDDLSHLKMIDANGVRALAEAVNRLTPQEIGPQKLVILLATGGTLAMKSEEGVRLPDFSWEEVFRPAAGLLHDRFKIMGLNALCMDSSQMNFSHTREMAVVLTYLWNTIKIPFIGFLITHGTDTMSYAGAATSLMMGQGLPFSIVYTGAQQPFDSPVSDGPLNLRNALYTLEALYERDMAEVVIAMGDRAMLATSAEKVNDTAANAFDAPRHQYVSRFNRLVFPVALAHWLNPRRRVPFKPTIWQGDYSHSLVVKSTLGLNPDILKRQVEDPEIRAVILYSYGAGTVDEKVLRMVIETAKKRDIAVSIVNPVNADYRAEYESAQHAIKMGAIPLNMTLSTALAKAEIALRLYPRDLAAFSLFMSENYVGEVPTEKSGQNDKS